MFAFVVVVGFFFHFFFLQNAFFPYLPFNYIETLETIKKKKYFTLSDVSMHGLVRLV